MAAKLKNFFFKSVSFKTYVLDAKEVKMNVKPISSSSSSSSGLFDKKKYIARQTHIKCTNV